MGGGGQLGGKGGGVITVRKKKKKLTIGGRLPHHITTSLHFHWMLPQSQQGRLLKQLQGVLLETPAPAAIVPHPEFYTLKTFHSETGCENLQFSAEQLLPLLLLPVVLQHFCVKIEPRKSREDSAHCKICSKVRQQNGIQTVIHSVNNPQNGTKLVYHSVASILSDPALWCGKVSRSKISSANFSSPKIGSKT